MSENPYKSPTDGSRKRAITSFLGCLVALGAVALVLLVFVVFLLPLNRGSREAARRNQCRNNLKQLSLALLNHESNHGSFPPAYTVDAEGNRLHSWRTLLVPYFDGQQEWVDRIDLTKPWDDPANAEAREAHVEEFTCPSAPFDYGQTTYFAVVGPECAFAGNEGRKLEDFTDGPENTILLIEAPSEMAVHWMSPTDVTLDEVQAFDRDKPTGHPGGFNAVFADGHVEFIGIDIDRDKLRAMLTIAGGENVDE